MTKILVPAVGIKQTAISFYETELFKDDIFSFRNKRDKDDRDKILLSGSFPVIWGAPLVGYIAYLKPIPNVDQLNKCKNVIAKMILLMADHTPDKS